MKKTDWEEARDTFIGWRNGALIGIALWLLLAWLVSLI